MKIHEYQAKEILRTFGVATPKGVACFSVADAMEAANKLEKLEKGGPWVAWVVKAQIHAGGRGKGGGVKVVRSLEEVKQFAEEMLGMHLVTRQTGTGGQVVRCLLIEQGVEISREFYIGMLVDRSMRRVCLVASAEGGMDIEEVAEKTPEKIKKAFIDPLSGLTASQAEDVAESIGIGPSAVKEASELLQRLYRAYDATDALLVEINPLVMTTEDHILALDAKMSFDDNALFRHPETAALRDLDEEDPAEIEASKYDLSYVSLNGNIGCLVNGAGLAMATMDIIKLYGGSPANFLDVGGGATAEKVAEAFKLMLRNPELRAILINIFGGIMKCDVIAEGVVAAAREVKLGVPLIVRLEGTNVELGRKILGESGLPIISAANMADAAAKAVSAAAAPESAAAPAPATERMWPWLS
jgi:succinyl-CoA synthetase beta subunit